MKQFKSLFLHGLSILFEMPTKFVHPETVNCAQIKGYQVRKMMLSWALRGGASVDSIITACHWKSHSTFSQFLPSAITLAVRESLILECFTTAQRMVEVSRGIKRCQDIIKYLKYVHLLVSILRFVFLLYLNFESNKFIS